MFNLSFNSNIVRTSSLMGHDNLYLHDTVTTYGDSLNIESCDTKRKFDYKIHEHYGTST